MRIYLVKINGSLYPKNCGLSYEREIPPIVLYENNVTYIVQLKGRYIKGDRMKHISPKFFFTYNLQKMVKFMCSRFDQMII